MATPATLTASLAYVPPGNVASAVAALTGSASYTAESIGIMDIPTGTLNGVEFPIPFGTVDEASCLIIKNTNTQDMCVRINAETGVTGFDGYQVPAGGELIISNPASVTWKTVSDGVTNTDFSFVSATANFAPGDKYKKIVVVGAGPAGADLYTSIASVTNPTTIILTDATSSSNVGVTARWAAPLAAASVVTTATQGPSGTVQYFVFGT